MHLEEKLFGIRAQDYFFRGIPAGGRVLELGCGNCDKLARIRDFNPSAQLYGCDVASPSQLPPFVDFRCVDLENQPLPYESDFFDAVIMIHVLEHLTKHRNAAQETKRVLKKGGLFYVEAPNLRSLFVPSFLFKVEQGSPLNFYDDPTHIRPWTKAGLYYYLRGNGFAVSVVANGRRLQEVMPASARLLRSMWRGDRISGSAQLWTIVGWSVYGIGRKE
jgi:SAM-dependent methyltransferase